MAAEENEATETDIFKQQEKTINLLYDVLKDKIQQPPQTVYAQTAPEPAQSTNTPNYLMYIIAGGVVLFLVTRRK